MKEQTYIVFVYNCAKCDKERIAAKIKDDMDEKFDLFHKYLKFECPECKVVAEQQNYYFWAGSITDADELSHITCESEVVFLVGDIPDVTNSALLEKANDLRHQLCHISTIVQTIQDIENILELPYSRIVLENVGKTNEEAFDVI